MCCVGFVRFVCALCVGGLLCNRIAALCVVLLMFVCFFVVACLWLCVLAMCVMIVCCL